MASIPKQLYVTVKKEHDNTLLGFLHGHGTSPAFEKKRDTQERWAYNDRPLLLSDGSYQVKHTSWDYSSGRYSPVRVETLSILEDAVTPRVWDNEPLEGFKLIKPVTRYSTSNKLWRIQDPRGIVFEISTGCLGEIIHDVVIDHGYIAAKCRWGGNKNLVVVK